MAKEHVQSRVTKNDTDNSEVHHEDYKQQGFEFEQMGENNQTVAIYNILIVPRDHA